MNIKTKRPAPFYAARPADRVLQQSQSTPALLVRPHEVAASRVAK